MKSLKAVWFRDVCRVMAVWFLLFSIHPIALGVRLPQPKLLYLLEPSVAHAQPPQEPDPVTEVGFPAGLGVARTLSSYTVAGIANNQLTITYTVFNLQAEQVNGILLVTTLQPGVTLQTASPLPDRNGQELAWSLGALGPFGSTSVELTVDLAGPIPLQLDNGARAFGNLNARAVEADTAPAMLRADAIDEDLLKSTPDANTTDPFVLAKAAELGHDPQRIFAFVRDEIGYESYKGSLRGARGTLWSKAGNALDQASLLVALLRASGIPARYVQGTLPDNLARELILSMFPPPLRVVGCLQEDVELANPANDPQLLAETREHYWVEFDNGSGFAAAAPAFKEATIGQTFTAGEGAFAEVPDTLRHKVTIRLKAEFASNFPAAPFETKLPLNETFNTAELVGKPLSLGHFVNTTRGAGLLFGEVTHTYSPYILIGQNDTDISDDPIIRGEDYQEFLSQFPLSSKFLSGLFLVIEVTNPEGDTETFEKALIDRIGFTIRQNGGRIDLNIDTEWLPIISDFDVATINISPSRQINTFFFNKISSMDNLKNSLSKIRAALQDIDNLTLNDQKKIFMDGYLLSNNIISMTSSILGENFSFSSDKANSLIDDLLMNRAYPISPRIIILSHLFKFDPGTKTSSVKFDLDLIKNDIRTVSSPIQSFTSRKISNFIRSVIDGIIEGKTLSIFKEDFKSTNHSSLDIFISSIDKGVNIIGIDKNTLNILDLLNFSDEAKARISKSVMDGKFILVPKSMIELKKAVTISWLEMHLSTGSAIFVSEDGSHQAIGEGFFREYFARDGREPSDNFLLGFESAFDRAILFGAAVIFQLKIEGLPVTKEILAGTIRKLVNPPPQNGAQFVEGFEAGLETAISVFTRIDPPIGGLLFQLSNASASATPMAEAEVSVKIVPDELFTVPVNGAQLPSVFRAQIQNLGPAADTFTLTFPDVPTGFQIRSSASEIIIPPGVTGEVGICVSPLSRSIAPHGTPASFSVTVTSTTNPAITASDSEAFVVPEVHGVTLVSDSVAISGSPGNPSTTTITLTSVGNVPEPNVTLDFDLPAGLTITGLTTPVTLSVGESVTQQLTVIPAADTPLNTTLTATITATFGPTATPQTTTTQISVQVAIPGALPAINASLAAGRMGRGELAITLNALGIALTELFQDQGSVVFKSRVLAELQSLIAQLDDPLLATFINDLTAAQDALAASTADTIEAALNNLSGALENLASFLADLADHNFEVALQPNSAVALPATPSRFELFLHNIGTETTTYTFSLSALPPGVTGAFSQNSITLAPGEVIPRDGGPNVRLTLTQSAESLLAFDFAVTVAAQEAPAITRTTHGAFTARNEQVKVMAVQTEPTFTAPGGQVNVAARLFNAVNQNRQVRVAYTVNDPTGNVIFTSVPQNVELTVLSSLDTIDLGALDTAGFAPDSHTLEVTVTELDGQPIPGGVGQGTLLIGTPITAAMSVAPNVLPPGTGEVTTTLQIDSVGVPANLGIILQDLLDTDGEAKSVAVQDNVAYVCGDENVTIVDISNPQNLQPVATFADDLIADSFFTLCRIVDGKLMVLSQELLNVTDMSLLIYGLDDPAQPQLLSNTTIDLLRFVSGAFVNDSHAFVSLGAVNFIPAANNAVIGTRGDFFALDLSDTAHPRVVDVLFDTSLGDGRFLVGAGAFVNQEIALVPSTSCPFFALNCAGQLRIVDISDPTDLAVIGSRAIPGTTFLNSVVIQGGLALVVGTTGAIPPNIDLSDPLKTTGNLTLTTLDITDPRAPVILETKTTDIPMASNGSRGIALGNGLFAVSNSVDNGVPVLVLVDANDPQNQVVTTVNVEARLNELTAIGNTLFTTSSSGLGLYDLGGAFGTKITAQVPVPKNSVVSGFRQQNLVQRPGVVINASSNFPGFVPERVVDGDLTTSWFTSNGGSANQGATPFFEVVLPQDATIREIRMFGNRTPFHNGFDILAGIFQLFDAQDNVIFDSGEVLLPAPDRDLVLPIADIAGVRRLRFTVTSDEGLRSGFSELEVIGYPDDLSDTPFAGAFHLPPTAVIPDTTFDTLVWEQALTTERPSQTITWRSLVTDLQPGEVQDITLGGTVDFSRSNGDTGQIVLPPLAVLSEHILALAPAVQTVQPGSVAASTLTVKNPTDVALTYDLAVHGVPPAWVEHMSSVDVPAQSEMNLALTLRPESVATLGEHGFVVDASTQSGVQDSVRGTLILEGLPVVDSQARGIVLSLAPNQTTAGQGTIAHFRVRLTNTGDTTDRFDLSAAVPLGIASSFEQHVIDVPPGLSNFREVELTLTPQPGTASGDQPFTVTATSTTTPSIRDQATGTISVSALGVDVALTPTLGVPGDTFQVMVTNTGQIAETFDLALGGPAGPFASLEAETVSLAPGASQSLAASLDTIAVALPGNLDLVAVATSQTVPEVQDLATATVTIAAVQSVTVAFDPEAIELEEPSAAAFLLLVQNTGNTEDAYTASISGTSGPILASLNDLDGQPTLTIPTFRLPGLATGALLLDAVLETFGDGAVTVTVTSQSNAAITASDTAMLMATNQPPVADAGPDQEVFLGETVNLDGNASFDPDTRPAPLTFQWHVLETPAGSVLTDSDIADSDTALAALTPDGRGTYRLALTVSDGNRETTDEILLQVLNNPPVADAGPDQNVSTGTSVTLDGSNSFDPDGDMITYDWRIEWSLDAKPAGSALTDADIIHAASPDPSFTPDVDGIYVFQLMVNDGQEASNPDFVEMTATTPNTPPNANAGDDQTAFVGDVVRMDGRNSNDPDDGPTPLTFEWIVVAVPTGSVLQAGDVLGTEPQGVSFIPDVPGTYVLRLRVSDGEDSDDDEVRITVDVRNVPPNARAGEDQTVKLNEVVFLDGSASDDPDNGPAALTFAWRFVSVAAGSALTNTDIQEGQTATPHFTPDVSGSYVLELQAFDGTDSDFDNVLITVAAPSFQEATALVQVTVANERSALDRRTRQLTSSADVTITNISATPIATPMHAVFLPSAAHVVMPEASGVNAAGQHFYDLEETTGIQGLAPGASVTFHIVFVRDFRVRFTFAIEVFGVIP